MNKLEFLALYYFFGFFRGRLLCSLNFYHNLFFICVFKRTRKCWSNRSWKFLFFLFPWLFRLRQRFFLFNLGMNWNCFLPNLILIFWIHFFNHSIWTCICFQRLSNRKFNLESSDSLRLKCNSSLRILVFWLA